ncbi:alpha/beta hydrolase [Ferruginibacter lapsinanis]|uniref:alpha/beta fold hydrolase n=1 Tax=Ferruginibacter lapsinanis TaxID=563172 RepID=UPI001E3804A2|nr:alpha/beta hydrolase [Ferruginibacter lapsinanis]UEG48495.1 alpha/beta hydrolase [Ferruginibacter lapsinanis]
MLTKTLTYNNAIVSYKTIGAGTTVMLLHGFGEDSEIWKHQISYLQKNFHLIIPDIPGSGSSALIPDADIDTYAEVMKAILDIEKINQCVMVGHSMGGYITLAFAEKYSEYLKSFALFHSSAFADSEEKKQTREKAIAFIMANNAYNFLKTSIPGLFRFQEGPNALTPCINELIEKGKNFTAAALIQYYRAMIGRPDRTDILRKTSLPVLFVIGEFDNAIPLESSLKQCYIPNKSHIHILHNSGHMGMLEETEKTNSILFKFLNSTS